MEKRRKNAEKLTSNLKKSGKLKLPTEPEGYQHSWYLYTVRLKDAKERERDGIVEKLRQKGIDAQVYYKCPIHLMPYYSKFGKYHLPETEKAAVQVFSLPVHPGVTDEQAEYISETVLHILE